MLCRFPRPVEGGFLPCGRCQNCRINHQKVWAGRILLESFWHERSTFVTLTYNDDNVPRCTRSGHEILHKPDVTSFLEKFRYRTRSIKPPRYFCVGEYGSETWRPHYHLVLFGHGLEIEPIVNDAWSNQSGDEVGFTQVGELTYDRAMYIAHYTLKKMLKPDDEKLRGRPPEFARMSTKPGIGTPAIGWLADAMGKQYLLERNAIPEHLRRVGDVFSCFRAYGKVFPLGVYMKRQLRKALGLSDNPRERAVQLGRFDTTTGEVYDTEEPTFMPKMDLTEISTPWRKYAEAQTRIARQVEVDRRAEKSDRQASLNLTTGDRI